MNYWYTQLGWISRVVGDGGRRTSLKRLYIVWSHLNNTLKIKLWDGKRNRSFHELRMGWGGWVWLNRGSERELLVVLYLNCVGGKEMKGTILRIPVHKKDKISFCGWTWLDEVQSAASRTSVEPPSGGSPGTLWIVFADSLGWWLRLLFAYPYYSLHKVQSFQF